MVTMVIAPDFFSIFTGSDETSLIKITKQIFSQRNFSKLLTICFCFFSCYSLQYYFVAQHFFPLVGLMLIILCLLKVIEGWLRNLKTALKFVFH